MTPKGSTMTEETPGESGVVLATLCHCAISELLDEIRDRAPVEVVELSEEPTQAEVDELVARLAGRRLAVRAEGTVGFDRLIQWLNERGAPVPFALLPCPENPPSVVVTGVPDAGDSGVDQLLDGEPRSAGILRSDHGEFVATTGLMLVRAGVTEVLEPFDARVSVDGQEVFSGTVDGDIHLSAEFGRLQVETVAGGESQDWTGDEVVIRAGTPIEVFDDCVGRKPARLRHTWTIEPDGFLVYAGESVRADVRVLLLTCGDSDVSEVLDELHGRAAVEVVELPVKPSREEVEAALAKARGRRVALRAGYESFEHVVHHLRGSATPLAILPDPDDPVHLGPDGAPFNESGVSQLTSGTVATAPVLRGENGELAQSVSLWDAGPDEAAVPFEARVWVDDKEVFHAFSDGVIRISLDVVGDAEVEFAPNEADADSPRWCKSGTTVIVESPTLLEAADSVEVKGSGHRHVWTVDPNGFDIYVGGNDEVRQAAETAAQEEKKRQARRQRLLAKPPPAPASTGVVLVRILGPMLLILALTAAAFTIEAFGRPGLAAPVFIITGVAMIMIAHKLSGRRAGDAVVPVFACVFYLATCLGAGSLFAQNFGLALYGDEVQAVVVDDTPAGEVIADENGNRLGVLDNNFVTPSDQVTVLIDPNGHLDPLPRDALDGGLYVMGLLMFVLPVGIVFIKSGLSWRRQRREDHADYLTFRAEEARP